MTINANVCRVELFLKQAFGQLRLNPDIPNGQHHIQVLTEAQTILQRTRADSDRAYRTWRKGYYEVTKAHKALRLQCDRARELCEQWSVLGLVNVRVGYLESDRIQQTAEAVVRFLENVDLEAAWVGEVREAVKGALSRARASILQEARTLAEYKQSVRARKVGFEYARDSYRAFFDDIKGTLDAAPL